MKILGQELLETASGLEKPRGGAEQKPSYLGSHLVLLPACEEEPRIHRPEHSQAWAWAPRYEARGHGDTPKPSAVMNNATKSP